MAAEPRTCSRTTTGRGQDSPESTAPDVPTALTCLSGASTTPTAPDEHGAQTSRAQRGALAPGTIMGRTGYETTRPRARAFENYHGPSSSARHSARRPWEGGRRMDGSRRSGGRALLVSDTSRGGKGLKRCRVVKFAPSRVDACGISSFPCRQRRRPRRSSRCLLALAARLKAATRDDGLWPFAQG